MQHIASMTRGIQDFNECPHIQLITRVSFLLS
jgi:hypothetical protein